MLVEQPVLSIENASELELHSGRAAIESNVGLGQSWKQEWGYIAIKKNVKFYTYNYYKNRISTDTIELASLDIYTYMYLTL